MNTFQETLTVAGLAVLVSMLVAVVIHGIVNVLGRSRVPKAPAVPTLLPPPDTGVANRPPPAHIAAIAAAVSTVLDGGRVVHIEPRPQDAAWAAAGRQAHRSSHNLGRRAPRKPSEPRNS